MAQKTGKNTKNNEKAGIPKEVIIVIGLIIAAFLEFSNLSILGKVGGWIRFVQFGLFGCLAYVFPILLAAILLYYSISSGSGKFSKGKVVFSVVFFLGLCTIAQLVAVESFNQTFYKYFVISAQESSGGGLFGEIFGAAFTLALSRTGAYIITIAIMLFCIFMVFRVQIVKFVKGEGRPEKETVTDYVPKKSAAKKKAVYDDEEEYEPYHRERKKNNEEELVMEGEEDGKKYVIVTRRRRLNHKAGSARVKPTRTSKRSGSLRNDGAYDSRMSKKAAGITADTSVGGKVDLGDVVEITREPVTEKQKAEPYREAEATKKNKKKQPEHAHAGNIYKIEDAEINNEDVVKEEPVVNVEVPKSEPVKAEEKPDEEMRGRITISGMVNTTGKASPKSEEEDPMTAQKKRSTAGKTLSKGEPDRSFKPKTTYRSSVDNAKLPPIEFLSRSKTKNGNEDDYLKRAKELEDILGKFGVSAKVTDVQVGPSVTRFELKPETGTRVNKITSLADDLKLNLAVTDIRIEAPIPGKQAIGIEVPNKSRQTVAMRELLESSELINHKSKIAFAAGKDISGNVVVADIAKMPHLLVAGTTGSGKSTFLNTMLMCILYRAKPSEVGLIIIDPKKIEFGVYSGIPHLIKDVVTDPGQAVSTLRWAVGEMTNRYQRMQLSGVRDFKTYNEKFDAGTLSEEEESPRRMPQIVIIIDELADLMMVAAKEAESLICRLAQLARAAGIHLVIATQRPSVDVVTGLIKANIPARVALLVASGVDSRTIIDMVGAEKLLGYGDMLFYPTGYVKPLRVQGAYVSDEEIQKTVKFLVENKNEDNYFAKECEEMDKVMANSDSGQMEIEGTDDNPAGKYDEYFHEAGLLCIEMGKASSSMLQRRFNIGFNRAARIIDQLYEFGAVGPQNGAKPREILVDSIQFEEMYSMIGE